MFIGSEIIGLVALGRAIARLSGLVYGVSG